MGAGERAAIYDAAATSGRIHGGYARRSAGHQGTTDALVVRYEYTHHSIRLRSGALRPLLAAGKQVSSKLLGGARCSKVPAPGSCHAHCPQQPEPREANKRRGGERVVECRSQYHSPGAVRPLWESTVKRWAHYCKLGGYSRGTRGSKWGREGGQEG